ncbi:alpha/beta hydrolase [Actinoplanes teichomyceticus]|uniref:alpha/beta hydrolase n=1 Tax=Actinoplanes teichomyceticus TaxID=1867 RepID=UPI000F0A288A|nr:alpha/beta hydrolase [Actinoplanes teichomyceticus]GIF13654.1 esterase [Actinoplanes teichomyceticus]
MSSWQMHGVAAFTRLVYRRRFTAEAAGRRALDRPKGPSAPPRALTGRFDVTVSATQGFPVYRISHRAGDDRPVLVYLHGGAYTSEIVRQHWSLVGYLADRTGCDVHVPIYGLAPAHQGLAAREFVTRVVAGLGRPCYLAGDSAGGGLALLAAQACPGQVAGVTMLAPWLDLSMCNPAIAALEPYDPWLARPGLRPIADAWAGGLDLKDPRLSPIYGELSGLPPLQILVGTRDITLADCRALRDALPATVPLTYHEQPGALHVYPLLPVPEARAGREAIVAHLTASLRGAP